MPFPVISTIPTTTHSLLYGKTLETLPLKIRIKANDAHITTLFHVTPVLEGPVTRGGQNKDIKDL